jgi:hypothetical protein
MALFQSMGWQNSNLSLAMRASFANLDTLEYFHLGNKRPHFAIASAFKSWCLTAKTASCRCFSVCIRGLPANRLDYQNFGFGVRNCPGGGHGELVLSGVYRSTVNHEQEVTRVLTNDLTTATSEPVWVTLPDFDVSSIKAVSKPKFGQGRTFTVTVTPDETSSSDGSFQVNYIPQRKQVAISFK